MLHQRILEAFQLVAPIFLVILLGWGLRKIGLADERWVRVLNDLAFYVAFPVLTFTSLAGIDTSLLNTRLILVNAAALLIALAVTLAASTVSKSTHVPSGAILVPTLFGNVAYLGYPISEAAFGATGLGTAAVVGSIHVFVYFTLVVAVAEYESNRSLKPAQIVARIARIPLVWAVILGVLAAYLKIAIPPFAAVSLKMLSGAATAVALLALGVFLSGISIKGKKGAIVAICALKLIVLPVIAWAVCALGKLEGLQRAVSVLQAAMPAGISTFAIADKMQMDKELTASTILVTTVLSVVTLPLVLALFA